MRVAVLGKGGAGKTTVTGALATYLSRNYKPILAIDADVNVHLGRSLGIKELSIHQSRDEIARLLEPTIDPDTPIIGSLPPSKSSTTINISEDDEFLNRFATWNNDRTIAMLTVGTYEAKDAGANCYHGKLQVAELIVHRLGDTPNSRVVVDMTAGIDALGTSLYLAADLNVFVVEPTMRSIDVYRDFRDAANTLGRPTYVIANKVMDEDDVQFCKAQLAEDLYLGELPYSNEVRKLDRDNQSSLNSFADQCSATFDELDNLLNKQSPNRHRDLQELRRIYELNCDWWYDAFYGRDLKQVASRD